MSATKTHVWVSHAARIILVEAALRSGMSEDDFMDDVARDVSDRMEGLPARPLPFEKPTVPKTSTARRVRDALRYG